MMHELSRFYGSFGARGGRSIQNIPSLPLSFRGVGGGWRASSSNDGGMSDPRLKVSCRLFFFFSVCFPLVGNGIFFFIFFYFSWDIFYIPFKNAGWHQFGRLFRCGLLSGGTIVTLCVYGCKAPNVKLFVAIVRIIKNGANNHCSTR